MENNVSGFTQMVRLFSNNHFQTIRHLFIFSAIIVSWIISSYSDHNLSAQVIVQDDSVLIDEIIVQGNHKTDRDIIIRELEFQSGDRVDRQQLELARKRIENLNLFNRVIFRFKEAERGKDLIILVWEQWYIFPMPIFDINEHDWNKISYGLGVYHANFRGRAENLFFAGWLGYNPGLNFTYSNRWFGGKHRFYTNFSLDYQNIKSKTLLLPEEYVNHRKMKWLLGKRHGIHWYTDFTVSLNFVRADNPQILWNPGGSQDRVVSASFNIKKDTRDLWQYPRNGSQWKLTFSRYQLLNGNSGFNKMKLDLREYRTVGGCIIAGRFFSELTQSSIPVYKHLYIGYSERIRGHFQKIMEGENRIVSSIALRVPVIRERYLRLSADDWFLSYLQNMKFAVYATLFHDAGAVWNQHERIQPKHWLSGSGVGLNIILPYSSLLRLEYAFDESFHSEYIIDMGIAF